MFLVFAGTVTWEAAAFSPYVQLLSDGGRFVYTLEIDIRTVR